MLYSGALTHGQVEDIYNTMAHGGVNRSLVLGCPGWNNSVSSRAPFGLAYGLLQHDMIPRFLLHFYAMSAHAYTRGTWTPPESSNFTDRDRPTRTYASTGVHIVPIYLKWMLVFEEPETRTLWLAKATPRDWLRPGEAPIAVQHATTRYGRVCFALSAATAGAGGYVVRANVTLPASFGTAGSKPSGGVRLRIRAPVEHAGRMSGVTVGGKAWAGFDAATETVAFTSAELTPELVATGLRDVVVSFSAKSAREQLRRAPVDMGDRVLY